MKRRAIKKPQKTTSSIITQPKKNQIANIESL